MHRLINWFRRRLFPDYWAQCRECSDWIDLAYGSYATAVGKLSGYYCERCTLAMKLEE